MNARQGLWIVAMAGIGFSSLQALAQGTVAAPPATAAKPAVATVGTRRITREDWERRSTLAVAEFSRRNGNAELPAEMRDLVRRQVLEGQVRFELLALEAKRIGVAVSPLEAEEVLKQDPFFNPGGKFDESRFLAVKTTQTAQFNSAIAALQDQIAARKLNERVEARVRPADAALREVATRELSHVAVDHLSLRRGDFNGTFPEPRERDVLAWYAAHQADYQRPARATLTVAFVNSPGLTDSVRSLPGGADGWMRRMKAVADSILGEVRKGATLEQAAGFLGPRSNTVVTTDNFPGYWRATDAQNAPLFDAKSVGKVLPEALPSVEGWLLVRVDGLVPAHVAPLREVAREIRGMLRKDLREHHTEYERRALYARISDSLAAPGWRIRWAFADTSAQPVSAPTDAQLEAWYRGHLTEYSAFDAQRGTIVTRSLAEVRDEVRARWLTERRQEAARLKAEALHKAWSAGRRDAALEAALRARESAALVSGAVVDTGAVAGVLADSLWSYPELDGAGMLPAQGGWIVWAVAEKVSRVVPTYEQARDLVARRHAAALAAEEEAGARRIYDANPESFVTGNIVHFSRLTMPEVPILQVKLTRGEVERWHRDHLDKYSAPELVTAKHILITPANESPEAVQGARERAADVLARARAGEDFARLAREYSNDEATKEKGGDLGTFGRGTMMDAFEREVFALPSGQFAPAPFKTSLGWHVVYCVEHAPPVVQPLDWVYTIVASDAATAKADLVMKVRADSLLRLVRTPAAAKAAAARIGAPVHAFTKRVGEVSPATATREYYEQIDRLKPGQVSPTSFHVKGQGYWISWVDSITPPGIPKWDDARRAATDAYRRGAGQRALEAKKAELDSMFAAGWSLDSVAALWGGPERLAEAQQGKGLPSMGGAELLDSLVVGGAKPPVLAVGQESGWIAFPFGWARLRVADRVEPTAEQVSVRVENDRAAAMERSLSDYFAELRRRYPVSILDAKMRQITLGGAPTPLRR